jgi:hypothetical protein
MKHSKLDLCLDILMKYTNRKYIMMLGEGVL